MEVPVARPAWAHRAITGYLRISSGRPPVSAWSFGRVTLIGDAAHPMQPIGGQSGSQAIVDARVLTAALIATSNPTEAQTHDASQRC
jgi:2-polyprenyl-6-methoxyphenol hydroxylase-like FAD-dependent oxidoreductase